MSTLADMVLYPGGLIAWLVVGLIAGGLAGLVMKGSGYGMVFNIIVGLIGAGVGGFVFGLLVPGDVGFWGSIVAAFLGAGILFAIVGACLLLTIVRFLRIGRAQV